MWDGVNVQQTEGGRAMRGVRDKFPGLRWEARGVNVSKSDELLQT